MPPVAGAGTLSIGSPGSGGLQQTPATRFPLLPQTLQAFNLLTAVLQRQLLAPSPSPDVEGSTFPSPFSPLPSELEVAIESRTPAIGFISPGFSKGNQAIAF